MKTKRTINYYVEKYIHSSTLIYRGDKCFSINGRIIQIFESDLNLKGVSICSDHELAYQEVPLVVVPRSLGGKKTNKRVTQRKRPRKKTAKQERKKNKKAKQSKKGCKKR